MLTALAESAPTVRAWRVLAAESNASANWTEIFINRQVLKEIGKPVLAVIRIDARRGTAPPGNQLAMQAVALVADWKKDGVPVLGIEIDYDCATDRLSPYRDFLKSLRMQMAPSMLISITALPSWIGSQDLPGLLSEVNETVLQVHSVMNPQKGLFDRTTAYRWAQAWSAVSPVPFRLALPTYWSRVSWNEAGQVVSIESEVPRYGTDFLSRELVVDPVAISSFIAELRRTPPAHLVGIAWFRLPTAEDRRAWTARTWHAVMQGQALRAFPPAVRFKTDETGARDVYLSNGGDLDTKFPAEVSVSAGGCELADALPPYKLERKTNGIRFRLVSDDILQSHQERLIGWIRCSDREIEGHASF